MKKIICSLAVLLSLTGVSAKEYHVSPVGSDANDGSLPSPLRTINQAAQRALPGDTVTVHNGIYREWINPLNGGESNQKRILYRVAEGEKAEVKGSEPVTGWQRDKKHKTIWKAVIPNSVFGSHNPFNERFYGDWLWSKHIHHTGDVYLNDVSLYEAFSLEKVFTPDTLRTLRDPQGCTNVWFAQVDAESTTIYANFGSQDPNKETVEVTVRPTCFYPTREGLDYITIRGFHFSQAATQWAAPTAEQIGMIATHWCKGWIIENNVIKNSRANGITLGKERSTGHNVASKDPRLGGTLHYVEVIFNTLRKGWSKDNIGSHIVRNNTISDCEQTGICGSMGGAFSEIYGNHIYNILVKQQFWGAEMAGIKLHGAVDTYIHDNCIHHVGNYGIWMDWMAQGARLSANLLYKNNNADIFFEVSHGPYVVDHNISLSPRSLQESTEGGVYANNLFAGDFRPYDDAEGEQRFTPYLLNHSTEIQGLRRITNGDLHFYNNIFTGGEKLKYGLVACDKLEWPLYAGNNLFMNGALPTPGKEQGWVKQETNPNFRIEETDGGIYLTSDTDLKELAVYEGRTVDASMLGTTKLTRVRYEDAQGNPVDLGKDYWGNTYQETSPAVGPWGNGISGKRIKVWPKKY